jgi:RHS repeat-associated protein
MLLPNRHESTSEYRYGFNGYEKDDEFKGEGNPYDFGARIYDSRVGRWLSGDPQESMYESISTYVFVANSPLSYKDPNGELIIFVNGEVGDGPPNENDPDKCSESYWDDAFTNIIRTAFNDENQTFYDGDVGAWPSERYNQAKTDFEMIFNNLERDENGKIIEDVYLVSHSKGSAWAAGFQDTWNEKVSDPKYADQFSDGNGEIDFSLMLAPHQSGYINVEPSSTAVVAITHDYDPLSDGAVGSANNSGLVINIETDNNSWAWQTLKTHTIDGFHFEAVEAINQFKVIGTNCTYDELNKAIKEVQNSSKDIYNRETQEYEENDE